MVLSAEQLRGAKATTLLAYTQSGSGAPTLKDERAQNWQVARVGRTLYFLTFGQQFLKKHIFRASKKGTKSVAEKMSQTIQNRRNVVACDAARTAKGKSTGVLGRNDMSGQRNTFICVDQIPEGWFKSVLLAEMQRNKDTAPNEEAWLKLDFGAQCMAVVVAGLSCDGDPDKMQMSEHRGCWVKAKRLQSRNADRVAWSVLHMATGSDGQNYLPF